MAIAWRRFFGSAAAPRARRTAPRGWQGGARLRWQRPSILVVVAARILAVGPARRLQDDELDGVRIARAVVGSS
jgi:hypothetical protein